MISAFTGGLSKILENTAEGTKRTQKKKNLARRTNSWRLLGARQATGVSCDKISCPAVLNPGFIEFLGTENCAARVQLAQDGLATAKDNLRANHSPAYSFVDFRTEQMSPVMSTCLQSASFISEPLQLQPAVLDKKLSVLNFLPVNRDNQKFNNMIGSNRTRQLEIQHEVKADDCLAKCTNLFIDGECTQGRHAMSCLANMILFLEWIFANSKDTFWSTQLMGLFTLLESDNGKSWLDYIVADKAHVPFGIVMEMHVIQQAIITSMIKNQRWSTFIDEETEIPWNESLGLAVQPCQIPAHNLYMAIAGNNQAFENPHKVYHMLNIRPANAIPDRLPNQDNNDNRRRRDNDNNQRRNNQDNGNGNRRPNNDADRNVRQRQEEHPMTDARIEELKGHGFLHKAEGRFVTFVHEFSTLGNKGMCQYNCYKGFYCKKTDAGTCRFAHIPNFNRLPARDKEAIKTWVGNTPTVTFVEGRGPNNSG